MGKKTTRKVAKRAYKRKVKVDPARTPVAYLYGRVSHRSGVPGDSLQGQHDRCDAYYKCHLLPDGYVHGGWYSDPAVSAYRKDWSTRPAGRAMFSKLEPGDCIIVDKMDRAFRSMVDMVNTMQDLRENKISICFVQNGQSIDTRGPYGMLVLYCLAAFAQFDSDLKSIRTKEGIERAKAAGIVTGSQRWKIGTKVVHVRHPLRQDKAIQKRVWCDKARSIMNRCVELHDNDGMNFVHVARVVNQEIKDKIFTKREHCRPSRFNKETQRNDRKLQSIIPRPFRCPDAKKFYRMEKEIRYYKITDPADWNRKDHPVITLEFAEALIGLPIPGMEEVDGD